MSVFSRFSRNGTSEAPEPKVEGVEKATHVALGAPQAIVDAVTETFERINDPAKRQKDLKVVRQQVEKGIGAAEKRGVEVRKQLPEPVERRLKVAEKRGEEARKRLVEQAKTTRSRVEPRIQKTREQVRVRATA